MMAHLVELRSAFPHLVCFPLSTKCSCWQLHYVLRGEAVSWNVSTQDFGGDTHARICVWRNRLCQIGWASWPDCGRHSSTAAVHVSVKFHQHLSVVWRYACWFFPSLFPTVACFDSIGATQFSRASEKRWVCPRCSTKRTMDGTQ